MSHCSDPGREYPIAGTVLARLSDDFIARLASSTELSERTLLDVIDKIDAELAKTGGARTTVTLPVELACELLELLLSRTVASNETIAALAVEVRKVRQGPRVRGYMGDRSGTPFGPHD